MLNMADFDKVFQSKPANLDKITCNPPACFVGSYAPISKAGEEGRFFNNTYLLEPNRKMETVGPVPVRSADLEKCRK